MALPIERQATNIPVPAQETRGGRGGVVVNLADFARRVQVEALVRRSLKSPAYEEPTATAEQLTATTKPSKLARRTALVVAAGAAVGAGLELLKGLGVDTGIAPSDFVGNGTPINPPTNVGPLPFGNS